MLLATLAIVPITSRAQAADASSKNTFARGKESTFSFTLQKGMIFVPLRLNGSRVLSFVLDTGSTRMLVDRALAITLGLKASGTGSIQGAGAGRIPIEFVDDVGIGVPGMKSAGYQFSTADLQTLQASLGTRVDGILGYEFFRRFVVTIDYESRTLTLTLPEAFHSKGSAQEIPIELKNKWAFVKADLVLPGPVRVQDNFLIDTGSSDAIDHPIVMKVQSRVSTTSGVGLGSPVQGATARATSFQLGRYVLADPIVSCCGATDASSRLIGSDMLKFFTISFDYPSSRIFVTPNRDFETHSASK